jgi:hypothetical protein
MQKKICFRLPTNRECVKIEGARNSRDHGERTAQSNSHRVHGVGRYVGCLCRQLHPSYSECTLYSCLVNESDGVIVSAPGERYHPPPSWFSFRRLLLPIQNHHFSPCFDSSIMIVGNRQDAHASLGAGNYAYRLSDFQERRRRCVLEGSPLCLRSRALLQ